MMISKTSRAPLQFLRWCCIVLAVGASVPASRHSFVQHRPRKAQEPESQYQEHEVAEEVFSYDISRPVKVAIWSKVAQSYPHAKDLPGCDLDLTYASHDGHRHGVTRDRDVDISSADVVLFNLAMLGREYLLPRHKYEGQLWIAYCSEPPEFDHQDSFSGDCHLLRDNATMSVMDAVSSYDGFSDFPSYFTPPTEKQMRRERGWSKDSSPQALATFVSSDCRSKERLERVTQLNASLEDLGGHDAILSYGDCLNTAEETSCGGPEAVQKEEWSDMRVAVVNRCMARQFAVIAENTDSPWYVTEKLWFAFASGAVPVYFGSEEVKGLVPPGSIIDARDYDSPAALASKLMAFGEEELNKAQEFKDRPVSEWGGWLTARRFSHMTLLPRICEAASKRPPVAPDALKIETPTAPSSSVKRSSDSFLRGATNFIEEIVSQTCRALPCCGRSPAGCSA